MELMARHRKTSASSGEDAAGKIGGSKLDPETRELLGHVAEDMQRPLKGSNAIAIRLLAAMPFDLRELLVSGLRSGADLAAMQDHVARVLRADCERSMRLSGSEPTAREGGDRVPIGEPLCQPLTPAAPVSSAQPQGEKSVKLGRGDRRKDQTTPDLSGSR